MRQHVKNLWEEGRGPRSGAALVRCEAGGDPVLLALRVLAHVGVAERAQPLDLRLVRYFVAVAQEGSVTRAAERLHLAQPSLSAAVKQLEGQLGVALFERSGRGIALTSAGELLLRRGTELLALADDVEGEVRDRGAAPAARLRLGLSPTARYGPGRRCWPPAPRRLRR